MPPAVIAAVAIGGAAIGGGAQIYAANKQASAARAASRAQMSAAEIQAEAMRQEGIDQRAFLGEQNAIARRDLAPFRRIGLDSLTQAYELAKTDSLGAERAQASKAIANRLASQGLLRSNAFGANLARLETDLSSQRFNRLATLGGAGQGAASQLASLSAGFGQVGAANSLANSQAISGLYSNAFNNSSQLSMAAAQARAQGIAGINNAVQGGIGNAANLYFASQIGK